MTGTSAAAPRPAEPMRGPDFVMEKVVGWIEHAGSDSRLELADGSRWRLDPRRPDYAVQVEFIRLARRGDEALLVSGDRAAGTVDRLAAARRLAVQEVGAEQDGRVPVFFHGPPSVYALRVDRPGAAPALALLRRSVARGASFDAPDLLVGIDTRAKEIVAVRALPGTD